MICCVPLVSFAEGSGKDKDVVGAVYTVSNDPVANSVMIYHRLSDGSLKAAGSLPTGGKGIGTPDGNPVQSQGSTVLTDTNEWLLVSNPGSDDITVFSVEEKGLKKTGTFPSGGRNPYSIAVSGKLVYVLNAGIDGTASSNVTGFRLTEKGELKPISGSTRLLSASFVDPAAVGFSPAGDLLVVTERLTSLIDVFVVGDGGLLGTRVLNPSHGKTPYGFAFGKRNQLFVTEANDEVPLTSFVSSYATHEDGTLTLITGSSPTNQTAACWITVDKSGQLAYVSNPHSFAVTSFSISHSGALALNATASTADFGEPGDSGLSNDGRFLYVLTLPFVITEFRVNSSGGMTLFGTADVPSFSGGLAVR